MRRAICLFTFIALGCSSSSSTKHDAAADKAPAAVDAAVDSAGGVDTAPQADAAQADGSQDRAPDQQPRDMAAIEALVPSDAALPGNSPFVYIQGNTEIRVYQLDLNAGRLIPRSSNNSATGGMFDGLYGAIDSKKKFFYALHSVPNPNPFDGGGFPRVAAVTALSINPTTGALTLINTKPLTLPGAAHLSIHPSDKFLYVGVIGNKAVIALSVNNDGSVGNVIDQKTMMIGDKVLDQPHQVVVDDTGKFLFVPCKGSGIVGQYKIATDGTLTENTPAYANVPSVMRANDAGVPPTLGFGPGSRHMVIHPDHKFAYLVNEQEGTVTVFGYDAANGTLGPVVETQSSVPPMVAMTTPEWQAAHILVSPKDKTLLYVSNRAGNPSIDVFKIDLVTGKLTRVEHQTNQTYFPRDFEFDPSGAFLVAANPANPPSPLPNALNVFRVAADGKLTLTQTLDNANNQAQFVIMRTLP